MTDITTINDDVTSQVIFILFGLSKVLQNSGSLDPAGQQALAGQGCGLSPDDCTRKKKDLKI